MPASLVHPTRAEGNAERKGWPARAMSGSPKGRGRVFCANFEFGVPEPNAGRREQQRTRSGQGVCDLDAAVPPKAEVARTSLKRRDRHETDMPILAANVGYWG